MAKKIEDFEFGKQDYDWDNWLDGDVWALKQGEDFGVDISSFRSVAWQAAKRREMKVRTELDAKDKTILYIQAYKNGE